MNLRFILRLAALVTIVLSFASCKKTDEEKVWDKYKEWRETNDNWFNEQLVSGRYSRVVPEWNREAQILMRWLNDTTLTSGNLVPYYNSTVTVKYRGTLYNGEPFDSSYAQTDSIVTMKPQGLIDGWVIALERMHVGDKVEIIVPYESGYGASTSNEKIPPYSMLRFDLELRDIPTYEIPSESSKD